MLSARSSTMIPELWEEEEEEGEGRRSRMEKKEVKKDSTQGFGLSFPLKDLGFCNMSPQEIVSYLGSVLANQEQL